MRIWICFINLEFFCPFGVLVSREVWDPIRDNIWGCLGSWFDLIQEHETLVCSQHLWTRFALEFRGNAALRLSDFEMFTCLESWRHYVDCKKKKMSGPSSYLMPWFDSYLCAHIDLPMCPDSSSEAGRDCSANWRRTESKAPSPWQACVTWDGENSSGRDRGGSGMIMVACCAFIAVFSHYPFALWISS